MAMKSESREKTLSRIMCQDIFHAQSPNGASLICLAMSMTETTIFSRTITSQLRINFDRQNGMGEWRGAPCRIDSIAPLPVDIHNIILGIDRKIRLGFNDDGLKLTELEEDALEFADSYYRDNPV